MIDKSTFDFLADLKKNNRREWYHANKDRFIDSHNNFIDFVYHDIISNFRILPLYD